jgi:predicted nucleic acid-binding protein
MIFVDTSAWFAAVVPSDPDYSEAANWLAVNREPLLTTDYVVDETLTLLRARGERMRARVLGERFLPPILVRFIF